MHDFYGHLKINYNIEGKIITLILFTFQTLITYLTIRNFPIFLSELSKRSIKRPRWSKDDNFVFDTVFKKYLEDGATPPSVTVITKLLTDAGQQDLLLRHNTGAIRTRFDNLNKKPKKKASGKTRKNDEILPQVISYFAHNINSFEEPTDEEIEEFIENSNIKIGPTRVLNIISEQIASRSKKARKLTI